MNQNKSNRVTAWVENLVLPTYPVQPPETNPMFFEKRNIQGSAGNIYPNPFTDRLSGQSQDQEWEVIFLENEYLQIVLLPALGGRVFAGLDKTNGYDFFYRQRVIKPALIGLFGPWISGGVEFNWPSHHRPSTFMPSEYKIEEGTDGSVTVWVSEHEPMNRMKGMIGFCLYPGKAYLDMKVQLYNRTPQPQTFLWWANVAVHIHEDYQVFFPPDVHWTVFHTRQFVTEFPIGKGIFNSGLDFGDGVDVRWWKNFPVPTSFFSSPSKYNFFGGYDHRADAGTVNVANGHISPGKKFFTWGNGPFGHQWQRNLADRDDPYLELMAGFYTDNQPDFSWLQPFESKLFNQYWYPIQKIGPAKNANTQAAVNLEVKDNKVKVGASVTEKFPGATVILSTGKRALLEKKVDLAPGETFLGEVDLPAGVAETSLLLRLCRADGSEIIRYIPEGAWVGKKPDPYVPAPKPADVKSVEELYLAGLHLEQYRHPVLEAKPYWEEALRRDPLDSRSNNALGKVCLRSGDYGKAEEYFRRSLERLTWRNFNSYDCEAHYNLGLALRYQGRLEEAYAAFYRAIWDYACQNAGYYAIAEIDSRLGNRELALDHATRSLHTNTLHTKARNLKAAMLRHLGRLEEASAAARETLALDPLDYWAHNELTLAQRQSGQESEANKNLAEVKRIMRDDPQNYLDLAFDYANAGLYAEATDLLLRLVKDDQPVYPMIYYTLGYLAHQMGDEAKARLYNKKAVQQPADYCFPWRLEEWAVLSQALSLDPKDARASYYLGNLVYDKRHFTQAIQLWESATKLDPSFPTAWRNLGLAAYNVQRDPLKALHYYKRAFQANPADPRVLVELDQLRKRLAHKPEERLVELQNNLPVVRLRDDATLELSALYIRCGQPEKSLTILTERHFHPWEGGEGMVAAGWSAAHMLMGRQMLDAGNAKEALAYFEQAMTLPHTLGESGFDKADAIGSYSMGLAKEVLGDAAGARSLFEQATRLTNDWNLTSEYYIAMSFAKLGQEEESQRRLNGMLENARQKAGKPFERDYFYPQNPSALFEDDLDKINLGICTFRMAFALLGLGKKAEAKAAFGKVLEYDPSNLEAWEEYKRL